jgi:hypothetical protein
MIMGGVSFKGGTMDMGKIVNRLKSERVITMMRKAKETEFFWTFFGESTVLFCWPLGMYMGYLYCRMRTDRPGIDKAEGPG